MTYDGYGGFRDTEADQSILKDGRGVARTNNLFWESCTTDQRKKYPPLYTLKDYEHQGLPSAYQIYMHSIDEFDAAMKLVGSIRHWRRLCDATWFMEGIPEKGFDGLVQWREDMRMRDASTSKGHLMRAASNGDTSSARKILDISTEKADRPSPGRPNTTAAKRAAEDSKDEQSRAERIKAHQEAIHRKRQQEGCSDD